MVLHVSITALLMSTEARGVHPALSMLCPPAASLCLSVSFHFLFQFELVLPVLKLHPHLLGGRPRAANFTRLEIHR